MALDITHEEQYVLITPNATILDNNLIQELQAAFGAEMENGNTSFIIDLTKVQNISSDLSYGLDTIVRMLEKENGLLVVAQSDAELDATLEGTGITSTPSLSEAVDYIFMEQIQRQLLEGDEDEEEI